MHLLKRAFTLAAMVAIGLLTTNTVAIAKVVSPCDGDFELSVKVEAPAANETQPIGVQFNVPRGASGGTANRTHTEQKANVDHKRCLAWQARAWKLLPSILKTNKRPERRKFVCLNVAQVTYRMAGKTHSANVCLGNAKTDSLSYAFRKFYEGTDLLVSR